MTAMISREGILAAMRRQPVDHVPCTPPCATTRRARRSEGYSRFSGKTGLILTLVSTAKAVFPWENVAAMIDVWTKWR